MQVEYISRSEGNSLERPLSKRTAKALEHDRREIEGVHGPWGEAPAQQRIAQRERHDSCPAPRIENPKTGTQERRGQEIRANALWIPDEANEPDIALTSLGEEPHGIRRQLHGFADALDAPPNVLRSAASAAMTARPKRRKDRVHSTTDDRSGGDPLVRCNALYSRLHRA